MHQSISDLPLLSGHPALDLVNTWEPRLPAAERGDHLRTPESALAWSERARIIDDAEALGIGELWAGFPRAALRTLRAVREIRDALDAVLSDFLGPGPAYIDLEQLRHGWLSAATRGRLVPGGQHGTAARMVTSPEPATLIADRLAWLAVELVCEVDLTHLGICPAADGGCGWLFIDRSRSHSRRWCSMDACGAQEKARRLTERRQQARTTGLIAIRG